MDPIAIIALFFGAVICFFGYPMIHSAIRVWGFLPGGVFVTLIAVGLFKMPGGLNQLTLQMGITFLAGGIIGAITAGPLAILIIFLSGTALGWLLGAYIYPFLTHRPEVTILTVGLALLTGLLSARFQEVVMIVSTAFLGALMFAYGANLTMRIEILPLSILFFLFLFFGAAAQYKAIHPETSWGRM
jgi:hypothetical protein